MLSSGRHLRGLREQIDADAAPMRAPVESSPMAEATMRSTHDRVPTVSMDISGVGRPARTATATPAQIEVAKLMVCVDKRLGKETPEILQEIAKLG